MVLSRTVRGFLRLMELLKVVRGRLLDVDGGQFRKLLQVITCCWTITEGVGGH